jgi:hypothetical protein
LKEKIYAQTNESLLISNKFKNATADYSFLNDVECICESLKHIRIRIDKSKLSTQDVAGFKNWLQANNVTVVYQLEKEEVYECTNIDLITYEGETNYIVNTGVIVPKSTLKVLQNAANIIRQLQEKVSTLESNQVKFMQTILDIINKE